MLDARSHSIAELEKLSGFDRRTIVYYIQQGLLPKVGRRGPNTRYPAKCLHRLRFIRALRDLQDQGQVTTVTLREMRAIIETLGPGELLALVERGVTAADLDALLARPPIEPAPAADQAALAVSPAAPGDPAAPPAGDRRRYGLADAAIRQGIAAPEPAQPFRPPAGLTEDELHEDTHPRLPSLSQPGTQDTTIELGSLLRDLEIRSSLGKPRLPPGASEQWTEIPITSRVFLSIRGLSADDAPTADAVARLLRQTLRPR